MLIVKCSVLLRNGDAPYFLYRAGHNAIAEFQTKSTRRDNINFNDTAPPGTAHDFEPFRCLTILIEPATGNLLKIIAFNPHAIDRIEGFDHNPVTCT